LFSSLQIKLDSGLTWGVDDEMSLFLSIFKGAFKEIIIKGMLIFLFLGSISTGLSRRGVLS